MSRPLSYGPNGCLEWDQRSIHQADDATVWQRYASSSQSPGSSGGAPATSRQPAFAECHPMQASDLDAPGASMSAFGSAGRGETTHAVPHGQHELAHQLAPSAPVFAVPATQPANPQWNVCGSNYRRVQAVHGSSSAGGGGGNNSKSGWEPASSNNMSAATTTAATAVAAAAFAPHHHQALPMHWVPVPIAQHHAETDAGHLLAVSPAIPRTTSAHNPGDSAAQTQVAHTAHPYAPTVQHLSQLQEVVFCRPWPPAMPSSASPSPSVASSSGVWPTASTGTPMANVASAAATTSTSLPEIRTQPVPLPWPGARLLMESPGTHRASSNSTMPVPPSSSSSSSTANVGIPMHRTVPMPTSNSNHVASGQRTLPVSAGASSNAAVPSSQQFTPVPASGGARVRASRRIAPASASSSHAGRSSYRGPPVAATGSEEAKRPVAMPASASRNGVGSRRRPATRQTTPAVHQSSGSDSAVTPDPQYHTWPGEVERLATPHSSSSRRSLVSVKTMLFSARCDVSPKYAAALVHGGSPGAPVVPLAVSQALDMLQDFTCRFCTKCNKVPSALTFLRHCRNSHQMQEPFKNWIYQRYGLRSVYAFEGSFFSRVPALASLSSLIHSTFPDWFRQELLLLCLPLMNVSLVCSACEGCFDTEEELGRHLKDHLADAKHAAWVKKSIVCTAEQELEHWCKQDEHYRPPWFYRKVSSMLLSLLCPPAGSAAAAGPSQKEAVRRDDGTHAKLRLPTLRFAAYFDAGAVDSRSPALPSLGAASPSSPGSDVLVVDVQYQERQAVRVAEEQQDERGVHQQSGTSTEALSPLSTCQLLHFEPPKIDSLDLAPAVAPGTDNESRQTNILESLLAVRDVVPEASIGQPAAVGAEADASVSQPDSLAPVAVSCQLTLALAGHVDYTKAGDTSNGIAASETSRRPCRKSVPALPTQASTEAAAGYPACILPPIGMQQGSDSSLRELLPRSAAKCPALHKPHAPVPVLRLRKLRVRQWSPAQLEQEEEEQQEEEAEEETQQPLTASSAENNLPHHAGCGGGAVVRPVVMTESGLQTSSDAASPHTPASPYDRSSPCCITARRDSEHLGSGSLASPGAATDCAQPASMETARTQPMAGAEGSEAGRPSCLSIHPLCPVCMRGFRSASDFYKHLCKMLPKRDGHETWLWREHGVDINDTCVQMSSYLAASSWRDYPEFLLAILSQQLSVQGQSAATHGGAAGTANSRASFLSVKPVCPVCFQRYTKPQRFYEHLCRTLPKLDGHERWLSETFGVERSHRSVQLAECHAAKDWRDWPDFLITFLKWQQEECHPQADLEAGSVEDPPVSDVDASSCVSTQSSTMASVRLHRSTGQLSPVPVHPGRPSRSNTRATTSKRAAGQDEGHHSPGRPARKRRQPASICTSSPTTTGSRVNVTFASLVQETRSPLGVHWQGQVFNDIRGSVDFAELDKLVVVEGGSEGVASALPGIFDLPSSIALWLVHRQGVPLTLDRKCPAMVRLVELGRVAVEESLMLCFSLFNLHQMLPEGIPFAVRTDEDSVSQMCASGCFGSRSVRVLPDTASLAELLLTAVAGD